MIGSAVLLFLFFEFFNFYVVSLQLIDISFLSFSGNKKSSEEITFSTNIFPIHLITSSHFIK